MTDETLSDKMEVYKVKEKFGLYEIIYKEEDVKEFIQKLKEEMHKAKNGLPVTSAGYHTILELIYYLDKLAGPRLTGQEKEK